MEQLLVSVPDAAKMLSISRSAIYELMSEGAIKSCKIGKSRLIVTASLHSFIETLPTGGLSVPHK
jgi:excisionase family DNA binding protein